MVGHWTFAVQIVWMTDHISVCSDIKDETYLFGLWLVKTSSVVSIRILVCLPIFADYRESHTLLAVNGFDWSGTSLWYH